VTVGTNVGTLIVDGAYNLSGTTNVTFLGSIDFVSDATTGPLSLTGGSTGGPGTLTVTGLLTWISGSMVGPGRTVALGGMNVTVPFDFSLGLDGRTLDNGGTVTWTGAGRIGAAAAAVINNLQGANWNLVGNAGGISGNVHFNNAGLVRLTGAGSLVTPLGASFTNTGTVEVDGGTLSVGTLSNLSGTTLTGGTYVVRGALRFNNADVRTNAASIVLDGPASLVANQLGVNALSNLSTNAGAGSFTIQNGRNFTTAGDFTNNGTLGAGAGSAFAVNGALTNLSGGTLSGGTYLIGGTLRFNNAAISTNAATIVLDGTGAAAIVDQFGNDALTNLAVNNGSLSALNGRNFTTVGNFSNNGTLTLGPASTFSMNGDYTEGGTGTLEVQLGGTVDTGLFGRMVVTGAVNLAGTLTATVVGTYSPTTGDTFTVLTYGSRNGDFDTPPAKGLSPSRRAGICSHARRRRC
jgi:hypothetical protein